MDDKTRTPNLFIVEWLLLLGALLVLGGFIAFTAFENHAKIEKREIERLTSQVRVINDNLGRQLDAINRALTSIRSEIPFWVSQKDGMDMATRRLKAFVDAMPGVRTLAILDAAGTIRAANHGQIVGRNFREREYFQAPLQKPSVETLYVSPPFKTTLGSWVINVVRMVPGPREEFAGVVSASLDPEEFSILLNSVRYAPDMRVGLNHGDGAVFMTAPRRDELAGKSLAQPGSFYSQHLASGREESVFSGTMLSTGERRLVALRTIRPATLAMDKPLMVAASRDLDALYAPWRRDVQMHGALFTLLALVTLPGLHFLQQRRRSAARDAMIAAENLRASRERLAIAADSAGIGVWELDFAGNRLIWDDWMHRIYGIAPAAFTGALEQWRGSVHPDDLLRVTHEVENAIREDGTFDSEFRIVRPDGEVRHVKAFARITYADGHVPVRMTGVNYDITDNIRNEQALARLNAQLKAQGELLQAQAFIDGLTGVANRRRFDESLAAEWRRCRRDHAPLALLMIDIDHFKLYNDHYGHLAGDACLQSVANALKEGLGRSHDLVARYGGEEFVCLLPDSDPAGARAKAEALRIAVEGMDIPHEASPTARMVTISMGVAVKVPNGDSDPEQLVAEADAALYAAKNGGRNRVCTA